MCQLNKAAACLLMLLLTIVIPIVMPLSEAQALGYEHSITRSGDCLGDRTEDDLFIFPDQYCQPLRSSGALDEQDNSTGSIVATPRPPTVEPPITVTETAVPPTERPTQPPPPTQVPTEKPTEAPTEEPEEECKNKNSGKDGTPEECNAGGGQEKPKKKP